ncbi:hypothetical protein [Alteribacillus sp. YIM 98480]|uniref:hypothetical protein n=1 Tax=Alteribacillus sp. YIM 98480 TaxID=2606599 RepID=UPI00131ABA3E|nr:hypothetical protein [Alteribacillus sp. YIM 98480]
MDEKERLEYLLTFHKSLTEQMKCTDFHKHGNWKTDRTWGTLRDTEKEIVEILRINDKPHVY